MKDETRPEDTGYSQGAQYLLRVLRFTRPIQRPNTKLALRKL